MARLSRLPKAIRWIAAQTEARVEMRLRRFSEVAREGWFGGNTHLHLHSITRAQADKYLREVPRADGLDMVFVSYLERAKMNPRYVSNEYALDELEKLLTRNPIWYDRTHGVGKITAEDAINWGYTGPCLRAAGVPQDLRKAQPYLGYETYDFDIPVGTSGDVYDRYLVRAEEMRQSLRIVRQCVDRLKELGPGPILIEDYKVALPPKEKVYTRMESLIHHFKLVMHGIDMPVGEVYSATEAANGELGYYLVSDGGKSPYRIHVRPPCFPIFNSFDEQVRGGLIADALAVMGAMNVIAGELDR